MKKSIYLTLTLMVAMTVASCGSSKKGESNVRGTVTTQSAAEFCETIGQRDMILIDVRTPKEYSEGHIAGAQNIDVKASDFAERIKDIKGRVAVYCRGGKRSLAAAEQLSSQGCSVYNLKGGIMEWQSAGYSTTTE